MRHLEQQRTGTAEDHGRLGVHPPRHRLAPQGQLDGSGRNGSGSGRHRHSSPTESGEVNGSGGSKATDIDVGHGETTRLERSALAILSLQDPDGINLEMTAPLE